MQNHSPQNVTERQRIEKIMRNLSVPFASIYGTEFFNRICAHICEVLNTDYTFVGKLIPGTHRVRVIGGIGRGGELEPFDYALEGTACGEVIGKQALVCESNVQELFPQDHLLAEMSIEGYAGIPLYSRSGGTLGIFVTLSTRSIADKQLALAMMTGYSERVSAEVERTDAEAVLRMSEEKFSKAFFHTSYALAITSLDDMKLVEVNEGFTRLTGFKRSEAIGKSTEELGLWANPAERRAFLEVLETQKVVQDMEATFRNRDGEEHSTLLSSSIIDLAGRPHLITVARDITKRKHAEDDLRASERNLNAAQAIAHVGSWSFDVKKSIFEGSNEATRIYGLPVNTQLTFEEAREFVHDDDKERRDQAWIVALQGAPYDIEYRILVDDEVKWVRSKAEIEFDQDGQPLKGIGSIHDITEHKMATEALLQKDRDIRRAYANVFRAVTDEKLLILTPEEMAAAQGKPQGKPYLVSSFERLAASREFLRSALVNRGLAKDDLNSLILASGEAVTNGVKHAGSCEVQVYALNGAIQLGISDNGPGIDFSNLPKATLLPGFSTRKSLGMGFAVILDICDRVLLSTGPEGTTLLLETGGKKKEGTIDDILSRGLHKERAA